MTPVQKGTLANADRDLNLLFDQHVIIAMHDYENHYPVGQENFQLEVLFGKAMSPHEARMLLMAAIKRIERIKVEAFFKPLKGD